MSKTIVINNTSVVFDNQDNSVFTDSLAIANVFGKEHFHVLRDIESLPDFKELIGDSKIGLTYYTDKSNRQSKMYLLDRDIFTLVVMGFTGAEAYEWKKTYIKAFNEMEKQITSNPKTQYLEPKIQCEIALIEGIAKGLKIDDASKLGMYHTLAKVNNLDSSILPHYVENTKVHHALTHFLKERTPKISAKEFNQILVLNGYLEQKTRQSKDKSIKKFYSVTDKGNYYGINQTSHQNKNETQPHWYDNTFDELFDVCVNIKMVA